MQTEILKNPLICARQGCIDCIGERPTIGCDCKYEILHALDSGIKIGTYDRPRRSGKTKDLVDLVNQFREFKVSIIVLVPDYQQKKMLEQVCGVGVRRSVGSLQVFSLTEFESNFRYGVGRSQVVYYFSDEISPEKIRNLQFTHHRILSRWQYVLGFYSSRG